MPEIDRFNPPFERAAWIWAAGAAIVAVALTYWATSGNEPRQLAQNSPPSVSEPFLTPPITQPAPARPAQPANPDEL